MIEGFGRRAPNLLRLARKASVVISEITSKGTALVAKQILKCRIKVLSLIVLS